MRRTILALTAGLALAMTAACNTTETPSATDSKAPSVAPSSAAPSNTKEVCTQVEAKIEPMMTSIGTAVGLWIGFKEAGATAQAESAKTAATAEIVKNAEELAKLGETANDPKVKDDVAKVATNMKASSDLKFLAGVTGVSDFEAPFTKEITAWVLPLALTCGMK